LTADLTIGQDGHPAGPASTHQPVGVWAGRPRTPWSVPLVPATR